MRLRQVLVVVALALGASVANAADNKPLFASQDPIHITIKGPFSRLRANRGLDAPDAEGVLMDPDGKALPIRLALRAVTRRRQAICAFPPLRVSFPIDPPESSPFSEQKKLKLVTHCEDAAGAQKYLLLEYAAYRIANVLTPLSFAVRLASIDYQELNGRPVTSRYGFFIENEHDTAKRNHLHEAETGPRVPVSALDPATAARAAIFRYLIGDVDWSMGSGGASKTCCHNFKLLVPKGATTGFLPIPYDFDSAGLVAPAYALPPQGAGIDDVHERRYRGYCVHNAHAVTAAADALAKRPAIMAALDSTPGLDAGTLRTADAYLAKFFDQVAADPSLAHLFHTCNG